MGGERASTEKSTLKGGMYEVNAIDRINAKVDALTQKIESLALTQPASTVAAVSPNCELWEPLDIQMPNVIYWLVLLPTK